MKRVAVLMLMLLGSACAHNIIIDKRGVDLAKYDVDLAECQLYADEVEVAKQIAKKGAQGALVGGLIGAAVGDSTTIGQIAGAGSIHGASTGYNRADYEKRRVVRKCLSGRGYKVLN